jgi:hypothetical protein
LLTVVAFGLFILSSTDGNITVQGDDVFFISHAHRFSTNYLQELPGRGYLTPFYSSVYDLARGSTQWTHLIFFTIFLLSGLLFYSVLQKFLGTGAALIGSMLYLAYIGKHETVTWISAGAYLVVLTLFFVSVAIALAPRPGPWGKAVLIALLNWVGVHLCEILIVTAPLYPFLRWLHSRLNGRRISFGDLAPTFLPLLVFGAHVGLIYFSTPRGSPPLWFRGPNASLELQTLAASLWNAFKIGLTASVGHEHYSLLSHGVKGFWRHVPISWWVLATLAAALVGVILVVLSERRGPSAGAGRGVVVPALVAGTYLTLFSPLVGFLQNSLFMPSRLLSLSGVGVSLITGVAASCAFRKAWIGRLVPGALLVLAAVEGFAMNSILYEHQTSWAYDSSIRAQLHASGIRPQLGDTIFISLPEHPLRPYWRTGFSQFEGGHAVILLVMDYKLLLGNFSEPIEKRLIYRSEIRAKGSQSVRVPEVGPHRTFCFLVRDGDYKLIALEASQAASGERKLHSWDGVTVRSQMVRGGAPAPRRAGPFDLPQVSVEVYVRSGVWARKPYQH